MKLFLIKHYSTPGSDFLENRALLMLSFLLPVVAINAYVLAEDSLWFAVAIAIVGVIAIPQRPTTFEAALPIRGRDIALARLLPAVGLGLATLGISVAISAARAETSVPPIRYAQAVAAVLLGLFLPRLMKPKQFAITPAQSAPPLALLLAAVAASLNYLSDRVTLSWLVVAVLIAMRVWWSVVPDSYQAAALHASSRASTQTSEVRAQHAGWLRMVAASSFSLYRVFTIVMVAFGAVLGSWWMFVMNTFFVDDLWQRSRWLQVYPISRRSRLWLILGPGMVLPIVTIIIGMQVKIPGFGYVQNLGRSAPGTYRQEARYFDSPTSVSMEYWKRAPGGVAPVITAPWGETAKPYVIRVFSAVYFNPYTTREANSDQFDDWQFRKLTTAVYGFPVALKDYDRHSVQPRRKTSTPRMLVLNIAAGLTYVLIVLFLLGLARMHMFWRHALVVTVVAGTIVAAPMGLILYVTSVYGSPQGTVDILLPLFEGKLLQLSEWLPSNILIVVVIAAVPVLLAYALLEWQFNRSEIVGAVTAVRAS